MCVDVLRVEKANVLYYLSDKKSVEKEEEKKGNKKEKKGEDLREKTGGDASGHEGSLEKTAGPGKDGRTGREH